MNYTISDFTSLTNKTYEAFLNKALKLFEMILNTGVEEQVVQPILNKENTLIDSKMTHAFGVAVIAALDAQDKTDDLAFIIDENDIIFERNRVKTND
ncbi:hypothetical protein [Acinetobacter baumannii]|uniref:hypothetical protein n=1 Tax=Acinetobacter baumannii TaxID=470 RepID=UPI002305D7A4|nr:hypothetical protein [Acinetobacter baumannii]MDB0300858.1 hypothetical protein [Acinetobacter baumannii]